MKKETVIDFLKSPEIRNEFEKYKINHIYLIGSFARNENNEKSDIDIMYEKPDNAGITFMQMVRLKRKLESKLNKDLDMVNKKFLNKNIKEYVNKDKILVF